jgi:hypothetical protein
MSLLDVSGHKKEDSRSIILTYENLLLSCEFDVVLIDRLATRMMDQLDCMFGNRNTPIRQDFIHFFRSRLRELERRKIFVKGS